MSRKNSQAIQEHSRNNLFDMKSYVDTSINQKSASVSLKKKHIEAHKIRTPVYCPKHPILNMIFISVVIVLLFCFASDVKKQYDKRVQINNQERFACDKKFEENSCNNPLQALQHRCGELNLCRNRDPSTQVRHIQVIIFCLMSVVMNAFLMSVDTIGSLNTAFLFGGLLITYAVFLYRPREYVEEQRRQEFEQSIQKKIHKNEQQNIKNSSD